jgi:hypothetical protein
MLTITPPMWLAASLNVMAIRLQYKDYNLLCMASSFSLLDRDYKTTV